MACNLYAQNFYGINPAPTNAAGICTTPGCPLIPAAHPPQPAPPQLNTASQTDVRMNVLVEFKKLLKNQLISKPDSRTMTHLIVHSFDNMASIVEANDGNNAKNLYEHAARIPGSSTRVKMVRDQELALDGRYYIQGSNTNLVAAHNTETTKPCVLKQPPYKRERETCERLEQEVKEDENSHLVPVKVIRWHEEGKSEPKRYYIRMPIYAGNIFGLSRKISPIAVVRGVGSIITALNRLHMVGFVHMDVKPANIFIDHEGEWYLGDFGACVAPGEEIVETTTGFLDQKVLGEVAHFKYDWFMLASTTLSFGRDTSDIIGTFREGGVMVREKMVDGIALPDRCMGGDVVKELVLKLMDYEGKTLVMDA